MPGTLSRALARPQTRAPPGGSVEFTHCGTCCRPRDCEPTSVEDRHFFCDETTVLITVVRMCPSQERFGVVEEQLRVFVHYQPSYYHFHVHFVHTNVGACVFSSSAAA